jgi:multisubunit Na+/H+ antiporter MnhG subunit
MDWLADIWASLTWNKIFLGVGLFLGSLLFSFAAIGIVMVKIPENYFSSHYQQDFLPGSPWIVRWGAVIAKNIFGIILVVLGIILSLPGVPGQGILTILLGLIMLDIPGKRPLEARIIKRPTILSAVNDLRARYKKPPLVMD